MIKKGKSFMEKIHLKLYKFLQTIFVTKWVKTGNMIVKTQNSRDKNATRWNLYLCIPLFIRFSNRATIEWE